MWGARRFQGPCRAGCWPVVLEMVGKLLACRTPALGCHVYACPDGHETRIVPHSCKSRFCPTCGKHATDQWADDALSDLGCPTHAIRAPALHNDLALLLREQDARPGL